MKVEAVAVQRRAVPRGGQIPEDYVEAIMLNAF